jgi:DNA polymerase-3 subunit beta
MSISFTTTHSELSAALDAMKAINTNRPSFVAQKLIRLAVSEEGVVTLESYDTLSHVVATLAVDEVDGLPGELLLDRLQLVPVVRALAVGTTRAELRRMPVTIREDGGTLGISSGGYYFTGPIQKDAEFMAPPEYNLHRIVTVDRDAILAAVTRLQVCAGRDKTLPMLTGIKLTSVDGGLEMAATDRYRLGVGFVATQEAESEVSELAPAAMLSLAIRNLPAGPLKLGTSPDAMKDDGWISLRGGSMVIGFPPVSAEFVKYHSLIPSNSSGSAKHHDAVVPRGELLTALKRARAVVDKGHHARLRLVGSTISVTAGGDEGRMESPEFPTDQAGDDLPVIAMNPEYIVPALESFGTHSVSIRYSTQARPLMIAEPGELDNPRAFRTLVMPARLPG